MTDAAKVRVGVTGAISKGAYGATAPTGTSGAPTGHTSLGYIHEDGIEIELPGAGDSTPIKAWQGGTTVRTVRTPSDDKPSWTFIMLETSIETVELYFGVTVDDGATEGSFEYTVTDRDPFSLVVDVIDGAELIRDYIPNAVVTDVQAHTIANSDAIAYGVTVEGDLDPTKEYNFKRWATALKTPA
ncbi:MAG TPA: hypothetical protein VJL80_06460 [Aeromicrobium sp.]|nr:hypothetical protein [Aeromicrobium sp.]HKY57661.1 hypothetical protein [Aeromicrobium sp.]